MEPAMRLGCLGLLALALLGPGLAVGQSGLPQTSPRAIPPSVSGAALRPEAPIPMGKPVVFQAAPSGSSPEVLPTMPAEVPASSQTTPSAQTPQISEAERRHQELGLFHQGPCERVW